jgi:hypothetical protein
VIKRVQDREALAQRPASRLAQRGEEPQEHAGPRRPPPNMVAKTLTMFAK